MNEKLFGNVGEKLKIIAKVYFWLTVASGIICAFAYGITRGYSYYGYRGSSEINDLFFIFLLAVPFAGYLTALPIYGFGELIQKTIDSNKELTKLNSKMYASPEQKEREEIEEALKF